MIRFKRQLSDGALAFLLGEGKYIIPEIKSARSVNVPFEFDIQIRENDTLMVYVGTTCVLAIQILSNSKQLKFSAHNTYSDGFLKTCEVAHGEIAAYLKRTLPKVKKNFFLKEGYYQNILCHFQGEQANYLNNLFIFDRECLIGYGQKIEKDYEFNPIANKYNDIRKNLQKKDPRKWGQLNEKNLGNELDMLAIDKHFNLHCMELKHGSNGSGIYWGPLQLAVYKEIFKKQSDSIFENIKSLIRQKVDLGLLPQCASEIFKQKNTFKGVISHLIIAEPNYKMNCWDKMNEVINENVKDLCCKVSIVDNLGKINDYKNYSAYPC
jgi:hypothetical protein